MIVIVSEISSPEIRRFEIQNVPCHIAINDNSTLNSSSINKT